MKKKLLWTLIYIAALAICTLIIYIVPSVAGLLESTYIVEHGSVELSADVSAYIVRNETVYSAGKAGKVTQLAKDGELVRVGAPIVEIAGEGNEDVSNKYERICSMLGDKLVETENGRSQNAGFVSYSVDGAEKALSYDGIAKMKKDKLTELCSGKLTDTATKASAKGEPVFKITDNGDWWLVFYVKNNDADRYVEGYNVSITIDDETVSAYVDQVKKGKTETRVVLCCGVKMKNYLTMRNADVKVTTASAEGLIIQNKSIVTKNKRKGVLVKTKLGNNKFVPIGVKADDGKKSAVCEDIFMDEKGNYVETIDVYDEIVTSPSKSDVKDSE